MKKQALSRPSNYPIQSEINEIYKHQTTIKMKEIKHQKKHQWHKIYVIRPHTSMCLTSTEKQCKTFLTNMMKITTLKSKAHHYLKNSLVKNNPIQTLLLPFLVLLSCLLPSFYNLSPMEVAPLFFLLDFLKWRQSIRFTGSQQKRAKIE